MIDLLIWLIVGAAAGWIAGIVVKGGGFGPSATSSLVSWDQSSLASSSLCWASVLCRV